MYTYGRKWQQALEKILKRLAYQEGPGFVIVEGPDASGKTDLLNLVSNVASGAMTSYNFNDPAMKTLKDEVRQRCYRQVRIDYYDEKGSVPTALLKRLVTMLSEQGIQPQQPVLVLWDNFELSFKNTGYEDVNRRFVEEILKPISLYNAMTIVCAVMASPGEAYNLLGITTSSFDSFLQL